MPKSQTTKSGRRVRKPRVLSTVVAARDIPNRVRLLLCVNAGGRCEFDGCNAYLFEDSLTLTAVNAAIAAADADRFFVSSIASARTAQ